MIGIVDYGAGNIRSVINAFELLGSKCELVNEPERLIKYDRVILPGVGAFGEAMTKLRATNLDDAISEFVKSGRPFLGICLGMQLLFETSDEFGKNDGLGLIEGRVVKFDISKFNSPLKIPHVGWNTMKFIKQTPINTGLKDDEYLYFVHSYHAICDDKFVLAKSEYGYEFVSAVVYENVYGFQPHPEKSHNVGLKILSNFKEL
ncbi:imidazole glycerol phosphate synthase subunit HisH [Campylobacter sp. faydin G-140]|uniref:imidazole glycerol phosphate synthase subunit HisH n=1 Tax=Campylobacter anatolicus TaxID=2829105 RepID=UPI001BA3F1E7|nr:imidazole glycerol phosphate synthase subunit HisH [Campylobacter anatolicus]MBR8461713.1 imidazole glycerol phosphate synthase subunit HisH [Campylobacter anatolicus]MBR8465200.1 imidazole glycerol phosphate synthase subunit HisH [Campylobacter anatolicus]